MRLIGDKLKASLLQDAFQGKLTKQLPEDGDARDLLKEIQAEKERLVKEKKIKEEKNLPVIKDEEIHIGKDHGKGLKGNISKIATSRFGSNCYVWRNNR